MPILDPPEGHTSVTVVVHQDDLSQEQVRRGLQHAVDGAQQSGPRLVIEGDHHRRGGQGAVVILQVLTAGVGE